MTKDKFIECHERIKPFIHNTPIIKSELIDKLVGAKIYFKCDNFQKMGAFKMRGATNAIMQLSNLEKRKGVVTHSSGNFAQALSLGAKSLNVPAYIVMPESAADVKKEAVKNYKGILFECKSTLKDREDKANEIVREKGACFIHPSNDLNVIIGQGTACKELLEKKTDLDFVFVPVGGGA
tara:strand:+ start:910 stop:1449 length:540 start_codon:yes stop_codon:yes gene_type:complete